MEQYSHLLISSDPEYAPNSASMVHFYDRLQKNHAFRLVKRPPWEPGIVVLLPSEKPRVRRNPFTGEEQTYYGSDREVPEEIYEITAVVEGRAQYTVLVSGEWTRREVPIQLETVGDTPYDGDFICSVQCAVRPKPVCTSQFQGYGSGEHEEFWFDVPVSAIQRLGVFTNPWTGSRVEVQDAGSARFWVRFEFGKWLFPKLDNGFDLLNPSLVAEAEDCFGIRLLQAGIGM